MLSGVLAGRGLGLMLRRALRRLPVWAAAAIVLWGIMLVMAAALTGRAEANGAATIILDRTQGPYRMVVGIIPARPVIPATHLAIQVFDAADRRPLRDTDIRLAVSAAGPPGSPAFGPRPVVNEQSLRYFEVDVPFDAIGAWKVSLAVSSERGEELFVLPLEVGEPGAQIQWVWIAATLGVIVAVGIWTWLKVRGGNDAPDGPAGQEGP